MRRFDLVVTCVCCALLGYFAWHAWKGPRGYPYRDGLEAQVASLELKYESLKGERMRIENRVKTPAALRALIPTCLTKWRAAASNCPRPAMWSPSRTANSSTNSMP